MMNIRIDLFHHFEPGSVDQKLDRILTRLTGLDAQGVRLMASEQQLSDDLDTIKVGVDTALTNIADLKAQIAVLSTQTAPVSQEQLDALTAKADGIAASLSPAPPV